MKNCVTQISMAENVSLVNFEKAPAGIGFLSKLFTEVEEEGINVDMISQSTIMGDFVSLAFTVDSDSLGKIMTLAKRVRDEHPTLKPIIKGGNAKIWLYGNDMANYVGVAAQAFRALEEKGIDVIMITTSEVDVSLLIDGEFAQDAVAILKKSFEVEE
ncbi:MAG: ACT domain-containing protein [Oscillospiraceae bacterium]|nr:ACT domain-containing protein [Oscillospiraceae bacterium]